MLVKVVSLLIIYTVVIATDRSVLRGAAKQDRIVYGLFMASSLYLAAVYIIGHSWPNLDQLFHNVFSDIASRIVNMIKKPH